MNARLRSGAALLAALAAVLLVRGVDAQPTTPAGDPKHGFAVFRADGCYECHGYQGQGMGGPRGLGLVGPKLAPGPIPYAAFIKQLRTPRSVMPAYSTHVLAESDAADIYAYLKTIPPAKPPAAIKLLQSVETH